MRRKLITLIMATVTISATYSSSFAAVTIYTNRALFEAAAGTLTLEDFNSSRTPLPYYFTENVGEVFNGFTVTATALNNHGVAIGNNLGWSGSNIDGTPHLAWGRIPSGSGHIGPTISIVFDAPITALGFDWKDTDGTDSYTLNIPELSLSFGSTVPWPRPAGGGFFGVISDSTAFSSLTLVSGPNQGGVVTPMSLDNLVHNAHVGAIPEPSSLAVWSVLGISAVAVAFRRRRRSSVA